MADDPRLAWARLAGFAVLAVAGISILVGVISGPDGSGIPPVAGFCLLLCGLSVVCSLSRWQGAMNTAASLALIAALIAGVQMAGHLLAVHGEPLPEWEILEPTTLRAMSLDTSVGILVFGVTQALLCLLKGRPNALVLLTGGLVASGIGLSAVVGHLSGLEAIYQWHDAPPMTLDNAFCLWLLGASQLALARHPLLQQSARLPYIVAALATPAGLIFDLATPPYVGASFIYIPFVLSAVWFVDRRTAFAFAIVCSIFTFLGYEAKVQHLDSEQQRLVGRLLAIGTDFFVAALIYVYKRAIEQNERVTRRFDTLMDNAPDAVMTIDSGGIIRQFNAAAERLFGYGRAEVIGSNVKLLMPEPYHSAHDGYLSHHAETGEKRIIGTIREVNGKRRDGTTFPLDLSISELPSSGDKEFVGVLRDLSARKRQEENLRQTLGRLAAYTADLERSNQELDDFAYIASHDLKEPLRGIHNHSRFLLEDYEDRLDQDGKRRLDRLVHLSQRMEKLVNDLLYFSRIGRTELSIVPTDLAAVLRDVVGTLDQFLEERHATVAIVDDLPLVTCDSVRVAEVFRNLIVNAAKYNDKPQRWIEIGRLAGHPDETGRQRTSVYFVRDNGKGIASEFHEDIFRMFKRLERSDDGGTGSGLTIVRKIVQRHGGHIWLESEPGKGTTFFFTLAPE
ncbi:MAG: PAS domain S-box protein [Rhizobium sp.]|nr:PAS domain S-box protein [Rhizobium sp.]